MSNKTLTQYLLLSADVLSISRSPSQYMTMVEPMWVQLGSLSPGLGVMHDSYSDTSSHGVHTMTGLGGHPLMHRAEAATKLIRNHEAVIRDVCNPFPDTNVVGKSLSQKHLKRLDGKHVQHVEEAIRMAVCKLLNVDKSPHPCVPKLESMTQASVWLAASLFVSARLQIGDEKPGRNPDLAADASLAMRAALMEVGREANGM